MVPVATNEHEDLRPGTRACHRRDSDEAARRYEMTA